MSFIPISCPCSVGPSGITPPININIVGGDPPGGFTPVSESRFSRTGDDDLSLLGITDLVLLSPVPAAGQAVVVTDLSYFAQVLIGLSLTSVEVTIAQVVGPVILWQGTVGFTAASGLGALSPFSQSNLYIAGAVGQQLEMRIEIQSGIGVTVGMSANFGGYLVTP